MQRENASEVSGMKHEEESRGRGGATHLQWGNVERFVGAASCDEGERNLVAHFHSASALHVGKTKRDRATICALRRARVRVVAIASAFVSGVERR